MNQFTARDRLKMLAVALGSIALPSCSGGGGSDAPLITPTPTPAPYTPPAGLLRNYYDNRFKMGTMINSNDLDNDPRAIEILRSQFNSVVSGFEMKADVISPSEGVYDFSAADRIIEFADENGFEMQGHTLLWHLSTPDYMLTGSKSEIKNKLQTYIREVVSRYKGRMTSWHVVNEVITPNAAASTSPYANTSWYQAVESAEYIDWAFEAAADADPDALLLLNEYGTEFQDKRERMIQVVEDLLDRGIPIQGVGHQFHLDLRDTAENIFAALDSVEWLYAGLVNHITEMDMSVYNDPGSCWETQTDCVADYGNAIPTTVLQQQARLYREIFEGLVQRASLESVTFWGVHDGSSWLNTSPIERTNYPLLFDRQYLAKPAFRAITDPSYEI